MTVWLFMTHSYEEHDEAWLESAHDDEELFHKDSIDAYVEAYRTSATGDDVSYRPWRTTTGDILNATPGNLFDAAVDKMVDKGYHLIQPKAVFSPFGWACILDEDDWKSTREHYETDHFREIARAAKRAGLHAIPIDDEKRRDKRYE